MSAPDPSAESEPVVRIAEEPQETGQEPDPPEETVAEVLARAEHLTEEELEHLLQIAEQRDKARRRRDKINAVVVTLVIHAVVIFGLSLVILSVPRPEPPQIVANASLDAPEDIPDQETLEKPTPQPTDPVQMALPDIVNVEGASSFSVLSADANLASPGVDMGAEFTPSMSFGTPTPAKPMTLFGQKMESEKLGVILDVSGSMAEFLPDVIREVDRNFQDAPVVYVTNALMQRSGRETEIIEIKASEVIPYYEDETERRRTPYWFLWGDLPRKAPQRYVDRLIQIFKTRKNSFLAYGGHNRIGSAIEHLSEMDIESLYIFSDFEDYVNEELAGESGKMLGRAKIKTYVQPAQVETESLQIVARHIAKRSLGRAMPPLVELLGPKDEPESILPTREPGLPDSSLVEYATPRDEITSPEFYGFRPRKNWTEITRLDKPEYTLVFYGPQARGEIFVKNKKGQYIQYPITFSYHSWKYIDDGRTQPYRRRKWLRNEEPPTFDGKELVWKMVLEDELKFHVHVYLNPRGMHATYVADPPEGEHYDNAYIYFRFPHLARERKDLYYGYDFPEDGLKLDDLRTCVHPNTADINLPQQYRDRFEKHWADRGFEPGHNIRHFDELIRDLPNGIRDLVVEGPSFGEREFHARTTSSKILMRGGSHRHDFEMWEGFHCRLVRSRETRTRFTKTEAIMIEIE